MRLRTIALAGVAAVALSSPAWAQNPGWYLGFDAGYDHLDPIHTHFEGTPDADDINVGFKDNPIFIVNGGYKYESGLRIEGEIAFSWHDLHTGGGSCALAIASPNDNLPDCFEGGEETSSAMINFLYDYPLGDNFGVTVGGGVGAADVNAHVKVFGEQLLGGGHIGFQFQGIAGFFYNLTDNLDLTIEYRYRQAYVDHDYQCAVCAPNFPHLAQAREHIGLAGFRYYLGSAPPPPPPAAPPPPPPPPPPPAPVKTFIVFFDFDKSNLTPEALSVVQEAVKTAKTNGMVKVLITGHTDTVGSDSYNQGLSVRRATTVKDEMVHEGMDGSTISIEGKSFHDPLVPTGPGVREPQNRRAVIDLGA